MPTATKNAIQIFVPREDRLPDNDQWENRFEVRSQSSGRIYIISQNKAKRHWGCSCPGWRSHRTCKHLNTLMLPAYEKPYEAILS